MDAKHIINSWRLNKSVLAAKMPMNAYTFKMKLLGSDNRYKFTSSEEARLLEVLNELSGEIKAFPNM